MLITEIPHPSHPPHLLHLERPYAPFICDGCKELGFGICYQCNICHFHLHKECAIHSSSFYHDFFKKCEFKFYKESPRSGGRVCDGCWKDVRGFVYQCSHENANDLHPCCARLPRNLAGEGVKLELKDKVKSKCLKCLSRSNSKKGPKGWSYVSTCGNYCFHVACVKEMMYEAWEMGYFDNNQETETIAHNYSSGLALQNISFTSEIVTQNNGRKGLNYWKTVASVLKLILPAIFGDPITAFTALIIALVQSLIN